MNTRPTQQQIDAAIKTLHQRIDEKIKISGFPKLIAFDFSKTSESAIFCQEIAEASSDLAPVINPEMCALDYLHDITPKIHTPGEA